MWWLADFDKFWNYNNIGCRSMVPQEILVLGTGEVFVVTAVEEKQILRHSCTATACKSDVNKTDCFSIDPENSVYVACHHSYRTSWGDYGLDIAADLVDVHGNVIGSVAAGSPIRFLLRDFLKAAGVSSLNNRASFGANSTRYLCGVEWASCFHPLLCCCVLTFVLRGGTHVSSNPNPQYRLIGINIGVYLEYSNVKDGWFDSDVKLRVLPFNR